MSTISEIESAIEKLPPEQFRELERWIVQRAEGRKARQWSPEELTAAAQEMIDETDPAREQRLWDRLVAGFYGDA